MIHKFSTKAEAFGIPDPKQVSWQVSHFEVRTGTDIIASSAPSVPTKDEQDTTDALSHAKLKALMARTPDEVQAWVATSVKDTAALQDAVTTLAIAVGILARRL